MRRTLFLLLAIAFLGVQMLSLAHAAEYGSQEHEHEGVDCEICLGTKYTDCASPAAATGTHLLRNTQHIQHPPADVIFFCNRHDSGITRAPPLPS